jgi:hypothetical protein
MVDITQNKDRERDAAIAREVLGWRNVHVGKVWWCEGEASPMQDGDLEEHKKHGEDDWIAAYVDDYVGNPPKYINKDWKERIPDFSTSWADVEEVWLVMAELLNVQLDNVGFVVVDDKPETCWRVLMGWGDDPVSIHVEDASPTRAIAIAALQAMREVAKEG